LDKVKSWVDEQLKIIGSKLPTLVHENPASFACGYNMGFKQCLLELDRLIDSGSEDII
jgi:hypothetical protein